MNEIKESLIIGVMLAVVFCIGVAAGGYTIKQSDFGQSELLKRGIIEHNQQTGKLQWKESK